MNNLERGYADRRTTVQTHRHGLSPDHAKSVKEATAIFQEGSDEASGGRLAEIDKLVFVDVARGLAILLVIWVHHGQSFGDLPAVLSLSAYGQMGVQLFFVASSFTLCLSATTRAGERNPVRNFYLRRFFRIAPLYYVAILLYFVVDFALRHTGHALGPDGYSVKNVLLNAAFLHSFSSSAFNSIVPGGWSIGTEMVFYLVFPLLFAGFSSSYQRRGAQACWIWFLGALALDGLVQTVMIHFGDPMIRNNNVVYCNIVNQLPVFIVGFSAFQLTIDGKVPSSMTVNVSCFLIFTLLAYVLLHTNGLGLRSALAMSSLPAAAGVSFAFLINLVRLANDNWLSLAVARIGQLSYSMYVFHFLFAWFATKVVLRLGGGSATMHAFLYLPTLLMSVLASAAVAWASKQIVEDRFINVGKRLIRRLDAQ